MYYTSGKCEKSVLLASISAVADIMRVHSSSVFSKEDDDECEQTPAEGSARRMLPRDLSDENLAIELQNVGSRDIVDILLELLDDEVGKPAMGSGKLKR